MSIVLSFSRRRNSYNLLKHHRLLLRRFSGDAEPPPGTKPESQESVEVQLLENLRKVPQHDWASSERLSSLLVSSSSSVSPIAFSQITRRLGSYSLAVSFLEYLDAKSQTLNRREESLALVFQKAIEFAGSEPDSREKLLRLYETAKEKNIPLTVVATKLLIRWFSRMGMVSQSVLVYERLDSNMKSTQLRNVVIDVLLRNGRADDAFKVLDEMLHKGSVFPPNRITAEIVFHEVWRGRLLNEEEMIGLISRFSSHGVSPNCVWLTRFITSLCRNARTDVAWEVLSDLMKNKAPLQAPSFNALLTFVGRNMEISRMSAIAVKMDEMGIRPDVVTLGILINTLCKSRRVDEALQVFQQMCGKRTDDGNVIKADSIHFNTLMDGLCKVGRMKEAEELLVKMKTEESCAPNTVTYNCLVGGYCIAGQLETAKEVVSRMKEDGIKPNVVTLNTLIGGMCRHQGVNMAIVFFADMQREGLKGNVVTYTTLIRAYCNVGNIENAMQLFDQMLEAGCSPDAKIYYALISGLCQARREHDAVRVVKQLKQSGFSLDLLAYNMLIGLFCDKNNVEKVYEMLTDMEEAKMKPDSITYNTLVSFFGKLKDLESVQKMMEKMREDGLHPTVVTYGVIVEAYCSAGDISEALKLFNDMVLRSKVSPNTVIYNILIKAFCKLGNLGQAMSLKEDMKEKMVRPNVETYNALFKCLNEVHQKETLFKLMDEMNHSSCEANQTTVEILMERLTSSDDLIKLKKFMHGYSVAYPNEKSFSFPYLFFFSSKSSSLRLSLLRLIYRRPEELPKSIAHRGSLIISLSLFNGLELTVVELAIAAPKTLAVEDGLWPDYNDGSWPSCCYRSDFNEKEISTLMDGLEKYWPSLSCGSPSSCHGGKGSFWGHEKHGTCSSPVIRDEYSYFITTLNIYLKHNVTDVLYKAGYVASNSEKYPLGGIVTAIQNAYQITPEVVCKRDAIDEIRICFYKDFKPRDCVGSKDMTSKKSCPKYVSLPEYTPLDGETMVLKMPTDEI